MKTKKCKSCGKKFDIRGNAKSYCGNPVCQHKRMTEYQANYRQAKKQEKIDKIYMAEKKRREKLKKKEKQL